MNEGATRVLLVDGSSRQALSILYGLKEIGCHVTVLCSSKLDACYMSRYPDKKILSDTVNDRDRYAAFLLETVAANEYDVLFPMLDYSTDIITENEEQLSKYVRLACADRASYVQAYNKQLTFDKAMETGIPIPATRRDGEAVEEFFARATFPVIIKPRSGVGSVGFHKMNSEEEFYEYTREHDIDIDDYVLQQFVKFKTRRSAHMVMDGKGNCKTAVAIEVVRWFPLDAGTATCVRTVDDPQLLKNAAELLRSMGWKGFADVCVMMDEETGEERLLEINGRIPAGVKTTFMCGCNVSEQLIQIALGEEVTSYPPNTKEGLCTRHSQADLLWFFKSPERFSCKPSWFNRKNTKDLVFSWKDPLPYFGYSIQQLKNARSNIKKRTH